MKHDFPLPPQWFQERYEYFPETGKVVSKLGGVPIGTPTPEGYLVVNVLKKTYKVHRIAWAIYHGEWPTQIDHINHLRMDNRLINLRNVSNAENGKNVSLKINNTSGVTGVSWVAARGKWLATIQHKGKSKYLGIFTNKQDAIAAREKAELDLLFHANHGKSKEAS